MIELIEETEQEHNNITSILQEDAEQTDTLEKSDFELLLDEVDAMKLRIAQLEASPPAHSHSINVDLDLDKLAELTLQKINALIRAHRERV